MDNNFARTDNEPLISRIIDFSARNRFLVLAAVAAAIGIAVWCMKNIPLDALPDLSDTQVIIYSRWDRSPDIMEDQVTYPVISSLLGAPKVKSIRGFSDFGYSYVYVIFEDGTDIYWARSRVLEYLSKITARLPDGVKTELGPDATGLGWVYQYALLDDTGQTSLVDLRSYQDWSLRFALQSTEGVAEVAPIGGFVRQYQVNLNPNSLVAHNIPLLTVVDAVRRGNSEVGGRLVEFSGREYMIRGRGYIQSIHDIENIVVSINEETGAPVLVSHLGRVQLGPEIRRGVGDYNGMGDTVSGIVVMRYGENALRVIERVKEKLKSAAASFPPGVKMIPVYDRSELILRSIATLKNTLIEEMVIVSIVIMLFLWHFPSATTAIVTIPISVVLAFIPLFLMGVTTNIMSLAGIAISIGVLVDGAIVEVENIYQRIQQWLDGDRSEDIAHVRLRALKEVGPSVFFSLLVIAIAFLPIFTLVDQEGRLFKPLAYSKNLALGIAAILAVTLDPAVRMLFSRIDPYTFRPRWIAKVCTHLLVGRYYREEDHPISRVIFRIYDPVCRYVLYHRRKAMAGAVLMVAATVPVYMKLGSEFMPPLNEGVILFMPTTLPGISVSEAERILQVQDRILMTFPEVERVMGKAGRADTSTDPAPFNMFETVVLLKPEGQWREKKRWYSPLPEAVKGPFRRFWSDRISYKDLVAEMDEKMRLPGWTNAYTQPIRNRIDMLSTGIRTPVGIKVFGADLAKIEHIGQTIEAALQNVPGTRSVYAERVTGGYFLDFDLRREHLAKYGLSVEDAQMIVSSAIGGENVSTTIQGRERYPVNVRYAREFRDDLTALRRVLIPLSSGAQIPISQIADIRIRTGPSMIRDENGALAGYVFVDMADRDIGGYVHDAKIAVENAVKLPEGYRLEWSGQYENMQRVSERLKIVVPLTLFLIFILLYMNTKSAVKTGIVLLAVPFSLIGAVWFIYALGYNVSIAVWVGMIALMGLDAETGTFMLLFLDLSFHEAERAGKLRNRYELIEAIVHGAVKRVRPKMMTVSAAMIGLLPIMWSNETGSDLMKRIAAPMIGGLTTSFILELLIYPILFEMWKARELAPKWALAAAQPEPVLEPEIRVIKKRRR